MVMTKMHRFRNKLLAGLLVVACLGLPLVAANEITLTGSLQYANPAQNISEVGLSLFNALFSITGKNYTYGTMSVPTTAGGTAIPVSNLSTLGLAIFKNNDATNYVQILTAASGTVLPRLNPGEVAVFRFDSGVTAPAALAHTAPVVLQYMILEN